MYIPTSINDSLKTLVSNYFFLLENDFPLTPRGKNEAFILSADLVPPKYSQLYNMLYEVLGVPEASRSNNLGDSLFDVNTKQPTWFNAPTIGLAKGGELGLMIGVDDKSKNQKSCFVPLLFQDSDEPEDGLTRKRYYYFSFDGGKTRVVADLVPMVSPYDDDQMRYYVMPNKPGQQRGFYLPFKVDKDVSEDSITAAWESGNFHLICRNFNSTMVSLSNCFGLSFQDNSFPAGGVLILLKNGKLSVGNYDNKKLLSAKWEIADSTHPNLLLGMYQAKQLTGTCTLGEVGIFYTGGSSEPYGLVNMSIEMGASPTTPDGNDAVVIPYALLYVQSVNMQRGKNGQSNPRYDFQPVHKATSNPQKLTMVFPKLAQQFPDFIMKSNKIILEGKMKKIEESKSPVMETPKPTSYQSVVTADEEDDWTDSNSDLDDIVF